MTDTGSPDPGSDSSTGLGQPSRTGRPSRPSARRAELLSIAAELFAERGFAGVTVDDLGAAAGISGPALYHHFDGKEALLGEMLIGISQNLLDRARIIAAGSASAESLVRLVAMHVDFALRDPALITVHHRDLVHARPFDREQVRALQNAYVGVWVDALTVRPGVNVLRARSAVHATLGLINSTPYSARLRRAEMVQLLNVMGNAALAAAASTKVARTRRPTAQTIPRGESPPP